MIIRQMGALALCIERSLAGYSDYTIIDWNAIELGHSAECQPGTLGAKLP